MNISIAPLVAKLRYSAPGSKAKWITYGIMAAILLSLTAVPLLVLLLTSMKPMGVLPLQQSELTVQNYFEVFGSALTYQLLANTFIFAFGTIAVGMSIAVLMAWLVERTDMPWKTQIYVLVFLPMSMPGFITAIGWTYILNPTNGMINVFLRDLFQLEMTRGPLNIYSVWGMVFIAGISVAPTMFLMLSSVVKNLDPSFEDAASASGASGWNVMRYINVPLLRPGLLSVLLYFFITAIEALEVPLILGMNAKFTVLSVHIYNLTSGGDGSLPNYSLSSSYALIGLILGIILLFIYFSVTRRADQYAVITGKGYKPKLKKLGKAKYLAISFFVVFFLFKLVLPLLVLVWNSLMPYFQPITIQGFSLMSFNNYVEIFHKYRFLDAVRNTLVLTVSASILCMLLATISAWMSVRGNGTLARLIDMLSFLPHLLPGMVIALAILLVSIGTPFYGALSVLIVGYIIRYLPFGVRTMTSVLIQISKELEEAAYASGASVVTNFWRIVLPMVLPAFTNGILWVASHTIRDITFPLFLISTSNIVIGSMLWESWNGGDFEQTAVISVLLVVFLLFIITPIQMWLSRKMERLSKEH